MIDARTSSPSSLIVGAVLLLILPFVAQQFGNAWVRIIDIALLYMLLALGLNIVVGYAGLLDLGYVAFYAVGAYMFGAARRRRTLTRHLPGDRGRCSRTGLHTPLVGGDPARRGGGRPRRRAARRADAEAARRLPGHRHARLRRDHPHLPEQPGRPGQHHQRPEGHHRIDAITHLRLRLGKTRGTGSASRCPSVTQLLLPVPGPGGHRRDHLLPPRAQPHRPRLDGDPRRRDRRQGDGHQHPQPEAARVRHGRHLRRRLGRDVREPSRASSRRSRSA